MAAHDTFKIDRLWFWAALTAAARLALIAAACLAARLGLGDLALLHDGWEYLRLAAALTGHNKPVNTLNAAMRSVRPTTFVTESVRRGCTPHIAASSQASDTFPNTNKPSV